MYTYNADLVRVVDGDTLDVHIDLGFRVWHSCKVRLLGVNAPEIHKRAEMEAGKAARLALIKRIDGRRLLVHTTKADDWQRWLGMVWVQGEKESLNDWLWRNGFARRADI